MLDAVQLQRFNYTDIHSILRSLPGLHLQEEEGYGLRPNIGIRGSGAERSARITLLEDGVLIAPAPYAAPAAYYFPTSGRLAGVEVLKGPAAITTGPYTVGGAVNLLTTPIPAQSGGMVRAELAEDATWRTHAWYGSVGESWAGLVETHQYFSDGFKDIDAVRTDTGFDKSDYMARLRWQGDPPAGTWQIKLQSSREDSNQSYLGLTDADFRANPERRYAASQLDNFDADHQQIALRWNASTAAGSEFSMTAYHHEFERSWYKTEGYCGVVEVKTMPMPDPEPELRCTGWTDVIDKANAGQKLVLAVANKAEGEGFDNPAAAVLNTDELQALLAGDAPQDGVIRVRDNAREYFSQGVQIRLHTSFDTRALRHHLQVGARLHRDAEDRLQPEHYYALRNGQMTLLPVWTRTTSNRIQEAVAQAVYLRDELHWGDWMFIPGLRYEHIQQRRMNWGGTAHRDAAPGLRSNTSSVWLPGFGIIRKFGRAVTAFAGVHKGFAPAGNTPGVGEESSLNYELGVRLRSDFPAWLHLTAFYNDYENLIGVCTQSSGGDCQDQDGEQFNGDAAAILGMEVDGRAMLPRGFLAEFNFSYTDAEFKSTFDSDFFGQVVKGSALPYVPRRQGRLSLGWEGLLSQHAAAVWLAINYQDRVCVLATSCQQQTDSLLSSDLSVRVALARQFSLYARLDNLLDRRAVVARRPYGARPNRPRTLLAGAQWQF